MLNKWRASSLQSRNENLLEIKSTRYPRSTGILQGGKAAGMGIGDNSALRHPAAIAAGIIRCAGSTHRERSVVDVT
jgi:hypothetical protein